MDRVEEVIGTRPLTRVFHAPAVLAGVTSLRGEVLPVIELALLFGVEHAAAAREARIVVVREAAGSRRRAGLRVDELAGMRELPEQGLAPVPSTTGDRVRRLLSGVIASAPACSILDVTALFDAPELAPLSGRAPRRDAQI